MTGSAVAVIRITSRVRVSGRVAGVDRTQDIGRALARQRPAPIMRPLVHAQALPEEFRFRDLIAVLSPMKHPVGRSVIRITVAIGAPTVQTSPTAADAFTQSDGIGWGATERRRHGFVLALFQKAGRQQTAAHLIRKSSKTRCKRQRQRQLRPLSESG